MNASTGLRTRLLWPGSLVPITPSRAHTTTPTARQDQTFSLLNGRTLGYAEYGNPNGSPLFFFHGFPTSRLEASAADHIARRRQLRMISIDRPGFGLSDFQVGRRIIDWPADVKAVAEHLQVSRFAVMGGSGGGPYALACAHALPQEMLSAVGVMGGAPPWVAGRQQMPWWSRYGDLTARYWPAGFRVGTDALVWMLRKMVATGPVSRRIDKWLESTEHDDDSTTEDRRVQMVRMIFDGFAQGSQGMVQEARLLSSNDWGFNLEDIKYDRIQMWHGGKDVNSPVGMIRYMAERLPHCELRVFEEESHFTLANHLEEILAELVPEKS